MSGQETNSQRGRVPGIDLVLHSNTCLLRGLTVIRMGSDYIDKFEQVFTSRQMGWSSVNGGVHVL